MGSGSIRNFADTSAYIKLFVAEQGSEVMRRLVEETSSSPVILSAISYAELHSAVARLRRTGHLSSDDAVRVRASVDAAWVEIEEEVLMPATLRAAAMLVSKYELRTLDAIQLASANFARLRLLEIIRFVSADKNLLEAARKEGFEVQNPCD